MFNLKQKLFMTLIVAPACLLTAAAIYPIEPVLAVAVIIAGSIVLGRF